MCVTAAPPLLIDAESVVPVPEAAKVAALILIPIFVVSANAEDATNNVAFFDAADPSWTSATFTANGAMIYNSSNSDKAIAILAFGGDFTVTAGTFTIVLPAADATNALIRLA